MSHTNNSNGRVWLGAVLIALGTLFFLRNFHFNIFNFNIFSWPFLLLIVGLIILVNHRDSFFGLLLIIIGGIGITSNLFNLSFRSIIGEYWPIILIIIGLYTIIKTFSKRVDTKQDIIEAEDYYLDIFSIFGERTKIVKTNNFLGGKLTSIFSDLKVSLRDSKITNPNLELEMLTIFGATEIYLPNDWEIIIKATTIFGGFEDQRLNKQINYNTELQGKTLVIKGLVLFGSVEIKS